MRRRGTRAWLTRALLVGAVMGSGLVVAHAGAPVARAACAGGWRYEDAISWAHAAVVGTIVSIGPTQNGLTVATSIRVERAYGIASRSAVRGKFVAALCADNSARSGTRVVVLFGIGATTSGAKQPDFFWTIGRTVTQHQADTVGQTLPNTATDAAPPRQGTPTAPWLLLITAVFGLALCLRRFRPRRPGSAGGATSTPRAVT